MFPPPPPLHGQGITFDILIYCKNIKKGDGWLTEVRGVLLRQYACYFINSWFYLSRQKMERLDKAPFSNKS